MSLVSVLFSSKEISIVTDGSVTENFNGEIKETKKDYKKFLEIDRKRVLAFAGHRKPCEEIIRILDEDLKTMDFVDLAQNIRTKIIENGLNQYKIKIALCETKSNRVQVATYDCNEDELLFYENTGEDIKYTFLYKSEVEEEINMKAFISDRITKKKRIKAKDLQNAQIDLNHKVAQVDSTVNKRTFTKIIRP